LKRLEENPVKKEETVPIKPNKPNVELPNPPIRKRGNGEPPIKKGTITSPDNSYQDKDYYNVPYPPTHY